MSARLKVPIPVEIQTHVHIPPIPKTCILYITRGNDSAGSAQQALHKRFAKSEDVIYLDAAEYTSRDVMVLAVVNRQGDCITSGSILTTEPVVGEEAAIAMAMTASQ